MSKHVLRECPDADEMEMATTPWYREPVHDPGNFIGRHRNEDDETTHIGDN
jgi:hypothetical protein